MNSTQFLLQIRNVLLSELERLEQVQKVLQSSENGELALEGVLAEKHVERSPLIVASQLPVRITHRNLPIKRQHYGKPGRDP